MSEAFPSPLSESILGSVTDAMVEDASGYREEAIAGLDVEEAPSIVAEATPQPARWQDAISKDAYDFIVRWETGGRAYYDRVIKGRPVWPGYASGITIGCGYDLGYHKAAHFQAQWGARLPRTEFSRLTATLGFKTVAPNRAGKVARAKALIASLSDIVVPWETAIEQFEAAKLPDLLGQLYGALDNLDRLHPHCSGALLSLVFNRGPAFTASGPRFAEMRKIRAAMASGDPRQFRDIPDLLRSMQRIWGETSSLAERRRGEAKLFEAGLAEQRLLESVAARGRPEPQPEAVTEATASEQHEDELVPQSDEADEAEEAESEVAFDGLILERAGPSANTVRWNPKDDEQPDYRHLDTRLAGATKELRPEDFDALVTVNAFAPKGGKLVFALRGARLVGGTEREDVPSITITDQRPDHRTFRCVIGIYDPQAQRLWAYQASTVPNATYVFKCYADAQAGRPVAALTGNILPTGCYTVTVGTHKRGKPGEIPKVLRLSTTADGASRVLVLRTLDDVMYDRFDRFVIATPADNVHPAQLSTGFSSAGCLTIPGRFRGGQHTGAWSQFRTALGLDSAKNGTQFSLMLLTGLDAVIVADARERGGDIAGMVRLRHGSKGEAVAKLQTALGLAPDPSTLLGPVTRNAIVALQSTKLGWADGIWSPAMDSQLRQSVLV